MFVDKTQFEAHLQTQATEVGCSYGDFAIPCCRLKRVLRVISADFQSKKLVMLLLQVMMIKTDRKAKYYFNCRMKVDTSVRTFVETHDSLASIIFDKRNFK